MTETAQVQNEISRFFREQMHIDVGSGRADLLQTGLLDSLTFVDLLLHLETKFGIKLSLEDLEIDQFRSVEKIADLVQSRMGVSQARAA